MSKIHNYCWLPVLLPVLCLAGEVEVIQQPAGTARAVGQNPVQAGPDESILWALFHAGKVDQLIRQISDLQQRFPGWQVPADLQSALHQAGGKTAAVARSGRKKHQAANMPPDACANIDQKWIAAEAQLAKGDPQAAAKRYRSIITGCKNPELVEASLKKAANLPGRDDYFNLTAQAAGILPEAELRRLEHQWLKNAYLHQSPSGSEGSAVDDAELQLSAERFRDGELAIVMAWRYFDRQRYREAYAWFEKAGGWSPANNDAVLGKMLSLEKLGDYDAALALYPAGSTDPRLNEIAGRLYKLKAWQDIKASQPQNAEQNLAKARAIVGDGEPEIQEIEAWIADGRKEYAKAAALFDTLYQLSPNREYARAYVRNQNQVNRKTLARRAEQSDGLLQDEYQRTVGQELYWRKQFLAAQDAAPTQFSSLANIDAPSADLGVYARHKSGEAGLGRLDILKMPTAGGSYTVDGIHNFKLSFSRVELDSGRHDAFSKPLGVFPISGNEAQVREVLNKQFPCCAAGLGQAFNPTDKLTGALETEFLYRMDGWFSPYVRLGHTPTGGVIAPTVSFDVGFVQQTQDGNWGLNVYSQPVRQSILSYTGIRDPYLYPIASKLGLNSIVKQLEWGRVLRSGIKGTGYYRFNERWGGSASAEVAMLNGENVADNTAFALSTSLGRNFAIPGFDYFTIGPALAYEHYEKNLSYFTLGQGGYFSPKHYINVGLGAQFLSEEGKPLLLKGHVSAGMQFTEQADSPWFPLLAPELGKYQGSKGFGLSDALDIELKGVWLLAPNLQLGAGAAVRHTANYEDFSGGLFVRVFFQDRKASYSSDIPDAMFNGIQSY
ncbi:MAG: cellulose synthase subunit BcsC-related outer membrane protein [Methylomonas sp.]